MIKIEKAHKTFVDHLKSAGRSRSTIIAYDKDIEQLIDHLAKKGVQMINEVTLEHLQDFMQKMLDIGLTKKTVSRKTNATKTFFRFLNEEGYIQLNVADDLKHPKFENKAPRILSKIEYKALRDTAKNDHRIYTIIELLLQTGVSIGELSQIMLDHIEFHSDKKGTLHLPGYRSRESRKVPLNTAVVDALKHYIDNIRHAADGDNYLFTTKTGNPMLVRNIRASIDRMFKQAGIKDVKVNDLRHTFIAHHLELGVSVDTISRVVGHKRMSTTEKYLDYVEREKSDKNAEEKTEISVL